MQPDVPYLPRLLHWWRDPPDDPGRRAADHPAVVALAEAIAPGSRRTDLGGTMSLNLLLDPPGLVLRVHQPFESARRLSGVQEVRRRLAETGLLVAPPLSWRGRTLLRCAGRCTELEPYLPHVKPPPTVDAYIWLFDALGALHRELARLDVHLHRPVAATYAPPSSLRRWLRATEAAARGDAALMPTARHVHHLISRLARRWVPAHRLPNQLVHGDARLGNVTQTRQGLPLYLDFGFAARRPRVHDVAYALAWAARALAPSNPGAGLADDALPTLITAYERACGVPLDPLEREALPAYEASVPLYFAALAGYARDPGRQLRDALPFLRLSERLLDSEPPARG